MHAFCSAQVALCLSFALNIIASPVTIQGIPSNTTVPSSSSTQYTNSSLPISRTSSQDVSTSSSAALSSTVSDSSALPSSSSFSSITPSKTAPLSQSAASDTTRPSPSAPSASVGALLSSPQSSAPYPTSSSIEAASSSQTIGNVGSSSGNLPFPSSTARGTSTGTRNANGAAVSTGANLSSLGGSFGTLLPSGGFSGNPGSSRLSSPSAPGPLGSVPIPSSGSVRYPSGAGIASSATGATGVKQTGLASNPSYPISGELPSLSPIFSSGTGLGGSKPASSMGSGLASGSLSEVIANVTKSTVGQSGSAVSRTAQPSASNAASLSFPRSSGILSNKTRTFPAPSGYGIASNGLPFSTGSMGSTSGLPSRSSARAANVTSNYQNPTSVPPSSGYPKPMGTATYAVPIGNSTNAATASHPMITGSPTRTNSSSANACVDWLGNHLPCSCEGAYSNFYGIPTTYTSIMTGPDKKPTTDVITATLAQPVAIIPDNDCGLGCYIGAHHVEILYWPVDDDEPTETIKNSNLSITAPPQTTPFSVVEDGFTFISPSVYVAYRGLQASAAYLPFGADLGGGKHDVTVGYPPDVISTSHCNIIYSSSVMQRYKQVNYTELQYPPPNSALTDCPHEAGNGHVSYNPTATDEAANPVFSVPGNLTWVDPAWSTCIPVSYGLFDPPKALQKKPGLVNPTATPAPATALPDASPAASVAPPIASATSAPDTGVGSPPLPPAANQGTGNPAAVTPGSDPNYVPPVEKPILAKQTEESLVPPSPSPAQGAPAAQPGSGGGGNGGTSPTGGSNPQSPNTNPSGGNSPAQGGSGSAAGSAPVSNGNGGNGAVQGGSDSPTANGGNSQGGSGSPPAQGASGSSPAQGGQGSATGNGGNAPAQGGSVPPPAQGGSSSGPASGNSGSGDIVPVQAGSVPSSAQGGLGSASVQGGSGSAPVNNGNPPVQGVTGSSPANGESLPAQGNSGSSPAQGDTGSIPANNGNVPAQGGSVAGSSPVNGGIAPAQAGTGSSQVTNGNAPAQNLGANGGVAGGQAAGSGQGIAPANGNANPNPVVMAQPGPAIVNGNPATPAPNGGAVIAGSTYAPGSQATVGGQVYSVGSNVIQPQGQNAQPIPIQPTPAPVLVGGSPIANAPGGGVVIGGSTYPPGTVAQIGGTAVSVGPDNVAVGGSTHPLPATPSQTPVLVGDQSVARGSDGGVVIGSSTIPPGQQANVGGHVVSAGLGNAVVDGNSYALPSNAGAVLQQAAAPQAVASQQQQAAPVVVGGQNIVKAADGGVIIGGSSIAPGSLTTVGGQVISAGPSNVVVGGNTYALPTNAGDTVQQAPNGQPSYNGQSTPVQVGGQNIAKAAHGGIVIGNGATLAPGSQTTVAGTVISAGPSNVAINGNSYALPINAGDVLQQTPSQGQSSPVQVGGQSISKDANGDIVIGGGTTLAPGSQTTVAGTLISAGPSNVVVNGNTYALPTAAGTILQGSTAQQQSTPVQIGGQTIAKAENGGVVIGGSTTLAPGASTTIQGHLISAGPSNIVIDGSSTYPLPTSAGQLIQSSSPSQQQSSPVVLAGQTIYRDATGNIIIGSSPLPPGAQTTIAGHTISAPSSNSPSLILDGTPIPFATTAGAILQTPSPNKSQSQSQSQQSPSPVLIGGQQLTRGANGALIIGSNTLTPGATTTIAGHTISAAPNSNNVIIDGTNYALPTSPGAILETLPAPIPTPSPSQTIKLVPVPLTSAEPVITLANGALISAHGAAATISGKAASVLGNDEGIVIGGSTYPFPSSSPKPTPAPSVFTVGNQIFTGSASGFVIDGKTVLPGGSAVTVEGTVVSLDKQGDVVVGSKTVATMGASGTVMDGGFVSGVGFPGGSTTGVATLLGSAGTTALPSSGGKTNDAPASKLGSRGGWWSAVVIAWVVPLLRAIVL